MEETKHIHWLCWLLGHKWFDKEYGYLWCYRCSNWDVLIIDPKYYPRLLDRLNWLRWEIINRFWWTHPLVDRCLGCRHIQRILFIRIGIHNRPECDFIPF